MDEVTDLKMRIMALEDSQRKTNKMLKALVFSLSTYNPPKVDDSVLKACKEYLSVFTGFSE